MKLLRPRSRSPSLGRSFPMTAPPGDKEVIHGLAGYARTLRNCYAFAICFRDSWRKEKQMSMVVQPSKLPPLASISDSTSIPGASLVDNKKQKIQEAPKEERLREEAYELALEANYAGEYVYPYIPISIKWIIPVEEKYAGLKPHEVASFYLKDYAEPSKYPKTFEVYQDILTLTAL
ncbi:hypothetical protein BUALT_Bualt13G0124100 [Buddleja alternifolia]|uniref:Uncharacterized protein n=1 Tax=Buddleja alternifolia TaxID=168488 RepID=A0AAV6WXY4_9LAMI|nr:hypothetical protein BUALT_Bualt13G0124100 [Buddleja alternifolia]